MNTTTTPATRTALSLRQMVEQPAYKKRFQELLKDRAPQFVSSMIQVAQSNNQLAQANPNSIISAALIAASLDLPIDRNLGFAHIVPYKGNAQFQMGYKGFVQLAVRTGQYRFLNACVVHEGELISHDALTGEVVIDPAKRTSDTVIGYAGYFKLVNGYEHAEYWTAEDVKKHAKRYSQAYSSGRESPWKTNFDEMALKTVIKDLLSHWGILSVEMQRAISGDQGTTFAEGQEPVFLDNDRPQEAKGPSFGAPSATAPPDVEPPIEIEVEPQEPEVPPQEPQPEPQEQQELPQEPPKPKAATGNVLELAQLITKLDEAGIAHEAMVKLINDKKIASVESLEQLPTRIIAKILKAFNVLVKELKQ